MKITPEQLARIYKHATKVRIATFCQPLNAAMAEYQINTPKRVAAFLAQIGHESGQLRYVREIWGPTPAQVRYEGRADLGNTEKGDGKRFMGRGLIQTTGRSNYLKTSIALFGDDRLLQFPELLEDPDYACRSAGWFWSSRGLNDLADAGQFKRMTRVINGGFNGLADRLALHHVATKVLT